LLHVTDRPSDKDFQELPFGAFEAPPGYTPPMPKKAPPADTKPPVLLPVSEPVLAPPRREERPRQEERRGGRRERWRERGNAAPAAGPLAADGAAPAAATNAAQPALRNGEASEGGADEAGGARFERDGRRRRRRHRRRRGEAGAYEPAGEGDQQQGAGAAGEASHANGDAHDDAGEPDAAHGDGAVQGDGERATQADASADADAGVAERRGGARAGGPQRQQGHARPSRFERNNKQRPERHGQGPNAQAPRAPAAVLTGMFIGEKGGYGILRREEAQYLPSKEDIFVPPHLVQRFKLRDGSLIEGPCGKGNQNKHQLLQVDKVDGKDPRELMNLVAFKKLTSIDPDFHYAVGDIQGDVSMRVLDVICPVGRGSRGLIVAPPRSGKTILMRKFANAITEGYPDVHLMVLLIDERPEEATEWKRTTKGQVFVSTNDEDTKNHVELAEAVFCRCQRLVELGQDVVLLLDSITRLARAYNNHAGTSGKTMSGGLDSRAMERPRTFFGMARNTETAGSLTILGTTLVETGSRMDQMVFEEFKGTGNMEIVLARKLADRRIFPAIDIERSGTRKDEKLHSATRLRRIHTLRRVLLKMNFVEAMELLISKLEDVDKIDDFLKRFETDPEA
jgi:transcription termination factor Rho